MTPQTAARALEPFYTTKEVGKGSGLGLSMVYGFARQSRGGLRIDSVPGRGTKITLYLPTAAASAVADPPDRPPPGDEPQLGSGSILVVEDDAEVRDVSVEFLHSLGYRTLVACNGREALELLQRPGEIDLLFSDMVMPGGVSGVALANQAQALRPGLPVLLTTGYAGAEGIPAGEFPVILKPFRSAELSRAIRRLLPRTA